MANGLFGGGEGTQESPFLVEDSADILEINIKLREFPFYHFKLTNDIDMSLANYKMIGDTSQGPPFMGVFDGDGYAVTGIRLLKPEGSSTDRFGMFNIVSGDQAIIRNLTIKDFIVVSDDEDSVAILASSIGDGALIENCYIEGTIKARQAFVGGLATFVTNSTIRNVIVNLNAEGHRAGALVYSSSDSIIENCSVTGELTGYNKNSILASFIRVVDGANVIRNSISKAILTNKYAGEEINYSKIAPLVDEASDDSIIENSFVAISSLLYPAWQEATTYSTDSVVKGTDGNPYMNIEYQMEGTDGASPVDGANWEAYWEPLVIPEGRTKEQLKDLSTFEGWDFENTWVMGANGPELKQFYKPSEEIPDDDNDTPSDIVIVTDVNFRKTKMIRDHFGSPIPQVWDHENERWVPVTLQMVLFMANS